MSIHGLKYQTVDDALGFTMDVYCPVPSRGNDMSLFRDSRINERMEKLGEWCLFGDSAYRHHSETHSYAAYTDFNGKTKSVRISIEWNYRTTASLFTLGMKGNESFKCMRRQQWQESILWRHCSNIFMHATTEPKR